jgi:hypothetical protein
MRLPEDDLVSEDELHPEEDFRRRFPLIGLAPRKTNCTPKTISEDAFREEDVRPERRIAPRRRTPKAHFAKTNSTPKTIYTLKTNSEDAFREDGFHPIPPEDEFRRRIPQRRIPPRRRIKVHPEARNYMELLKFFTASFVSNVGMETASLKGRWRSSRVAKIYWPMGPTRYDL